MGMMDYLAKGLRIGRKRGEPKRDSVPYARLMQLGVTFNQKAQVKPSPPNIRYFSRTPYARRAIHAIRNPVQSLGWKIEPAQGVKPNTFLNKQIAIATSCLKHPNRDDNWREFIGVVIEDWLCYGGGVFEHQIGSNPIRPLWMWPVDAQSIQIFAGWSGNPNEPRYIQTLGYTNVGFLEGRPLRNDEIVYIKCNSSTETPYGFGPLEIAFNTINRQLGVAEFTGNLASNASPATMLWFQNADPEKLRSFRAYWRNEVEGQGMTPMYGGPNEPKAINLYPQGDSALYLEYQQFVIRELAVAFDLSPMSLGIERDVNRNTAEVAKDNDWDNAVVPLAELISEYITRQVLHSKLGFFQLEFKFDGLYREDEESIANIYEIYYKNNLITPNEHREEIGMPRIENEWGDRTFADFQIAQAAARGTQTIADPDLPGGVGGQANTNAKLSQQTTLDEQSLSNFENQ